MTGNGNLIIGDFTKAGYHSRVLTDEESKLLNKNDNLHLLAAHYKAIAAEDLQAILNLYVTRPESDAYQDFAKTLAGFRREQSNIVTSYEPGIRAAYNLAAGGAKPYEVVEKALHPELELARRARVDIERKEYPKYLRQAVAAETGQTIYHFMNFLAEIEEKCVFAEKKPRLTLYSKISMNLREYAADQCDADSMYLHYVENIYKHINAVRRFKSSRMTDGHRTGENIIPFKRGAKPHLTVVK